MDKHTVIALLSCCFFIYTFLSLIQSSCSSVNCRDFSLFLIWNIIGTSESISHQMPQISLALMCLLKRFKTKIEFTFLAFDNVFISFFTRPQLLIFVFKARMHVWIGKHLLSHSSELINHTWHTFLIFIFLAVWFVPINVLLCECVCVCFLECSFGGAVAPVWPHWLKDWEWRETQNLIHWHQILVRNSVENESTPWYM